MLRQCPPRLQQTMFTIFFTMAVPLILRISALLLCCDAFQLPITHRQRSGALYADASADPGWIKTVQTPGTGLPVNNGDICTLKYSCYLPGEKTTIPFSRSDSQKVVVGDGSMITGWDVALKTMRIGERSLVRLSDPSLGYGSQGVPSVGIPPNAVIEMDLQVIDSQPAATNIDFDNFANIDAMPRTAAEIDAAYQQRQALKANEPQLEGIEYWVDKIKGFYFFGLFEGETGERAPWFLRPSITFPLAFAVVGAAFYVSYVGGAISERGATIKDELDEIILSSNMILQNSQIMASIDELPM